VPVTHQAAGARAHWSLLGHSSHRWGRDVAPAQQTAPMLCLLGGRSLGVGDWGIHAPSWETSGGGLPCRALHGLKIARPRGPGVLWQTPQMRKRRWGPLGEGGVGLPLLQARLLCPPGTRLGSAGAPVPFPHAPQEAVLSRRGRTLLRKPSTAPKSFSLRVSPPPGQIHAVQGCPTHLTKVLGFSTPQKGCSHAAFPRDQASPAQGYRAQPGLRYVKSWLPGTAGLDQGAWSSHSSPKAAPRSTMSSTKSPTKKSIAETPCFGWQHGRDQADLGTVSSQGGQLGFGVGTWPLSPPRAQGRQQAVMPGDFSPGASPRAELV